MNLEDIMLSEIKQVSKGKKKTSMIPLTQIFREVQSIQSERMVVARGWSWCKQLSFNGWMGWEIFTRP